MKDYDKNNLMFIMQLDKDHMESWYIQLSEDDRIYAEELIIQFRAELSVRELELSDDVGCLQNAEQLLGRFTLSGKVK